MLDLQIDALPSDFLPKIASLPKISTHLDPTTVLLSLASAALVFGWPILVQKTGIRFLQRVPGSIIALIAGTAAVSLLHLSVETIGTRFGGIPSSLPALTFPAINIGIIHNLIRPTLTIALLGAIESPALRAKSRTGWIGDRHNPNQELMAQGTANIGSTSPWWLLRDGHDRAHGY